MITLFQIDKSGSEIFEKDYSISLVKNNEEIYGINLKSDIKNEIIALYNKNELGLDNSKNGRLRFRIRFHTAIIILLLEKAIKDEGKIDEMNIQLCNDIDGHFHDISDMIYKRISRLVPSFKRENIVQAKFTKSSIVNTAAKNLRDKITKETNLYTVPNININELINIIKK